MNSYRKHSKFFGLLVSTSITLTGCQTFDDIHLGPKLGIKIPIEEKYSEEQQASLVENSEDNLMFSQLDNSEDLSTDMQAAPKKVFLGSGQFMKKGSTSTGVQLVGEGKYSVNLDAADIGEVCKIILSDMLHENYVLSPKVRGSITLQTTRPLHKEELLSTLEMLLRVNGAVLIKQQGIYRIEPNAMAVHAADTSQISSSQLGVGYQIKVMPLQYVGAEDMAEIIKPVLPAKAIIKVDSARNLLFVAGTRDELTKALNLVQTFDVNFIAGMSFGLYPLENTEVDSIVADIENIFNQGGKNPLAGILRFISIKHLNAVLVVTPQKAYLREAEKWIRRLDQQNDIAGEGGIMVYRVQHVDAVKLAETLNSIISGVTASSRRNGPSVAPGRRVTTISNKSKKLTVNTKRSNNLGSTSLEGVSIVADESNNALVIMAEPQQYRMLSKVIKRLDVMPLQVMLDATIVAVNLTENLEYGVKWLFKNSGPDGLEGLSILGAAGSAALAAASGGFTYGLQRSAGDVRLVFNALAADDKLNVLSAPSLMVLNNQEATIKVGDQIPVRLSETTNTDGLGNLQTSPIEMVDTGVILKIKPRVNATGVVILEIEQSVNTPKINKSSNIDSPAILKREIKSTVAVVSGESVVLGGLISETHTFSNTGIPFLKDIPYIGWLFGTQGRSIEKNELIIVITPRVIVNQFDARKVTDEFKRKLTGIYYDQDTYTPDPSQELRSYDGFIIQSDADRVKPMQREE